MAKRKAPVTKIAKILRRSETGGSDQAKPFPPSSGERVLDEFAERLGVGGA